MVRLSSLLILSMLGCSETGLSNQLRNGDNDSDTDTSDIGSGTRPLGEDCADKVVDGFDATMNEECENEIEAGTFDPVLEWKSLFPTDPSSNWVMSTPVVGQLTDDNSDGKIDEDDIPDVVVVTFSGSGVRLRALSGDGSGQHWSVAANIQMTGGAALGDIDNDGEIDIVALTGTGAIAFTRTGAVKWTNSSLSGHIHGTSDVASITDMDGDGNVEIIAGRAIMDGRTGRLLGAGKYGIAGVNRNNVGTASFAVDIDDDGQQEVVVGNALYRKDGSAIWQNGQPDGYPAVADFDGDGLGEIVVSGNGRLRMQDTDGRVLWVKEIPGAGSAYYGGPPTVADFDGDGEPEIGVAAGSRYSVFNADGSILWQRVTNDSSSGNTGSTVFDFEGDGVAEVVYADQTKLWVFNGVDGAVKLESALHSNGTWLEYPVVADVDGDGAAEIIVPNTPQNGSHIGFYVFGDRSSSWRKGREIWNQHAYHITNINDDGSIPAVQDLNWLSYNNFRSADLLVKEGLDAPDLVLAREEVCEIDCDDGDLRLWVHPGNQGVSDVAEVTVEVFRVTDEGQTLLGSRPYVDMKAGLYEKAEPWIFEGLDWSKTKSLLVRVSSAELECDDTNNELVIAGPFCE